ncbi:phytanoyl-CoA dioxygenase family protein [Catelliglobosispora koreensis]|uniref:phytanoyl-CoA dioxygenase family protein n=1 Tax=Catelliglobosispora koreensis TaxID=129052 RepID=UPI000475E4A3|nr:phytanoyl-CoA dioxygenase family protein [Catelliglobosispora koreensis]
MPVTSNGVPLHAAPAPMRVSSPGDADLRQRFARDGYVLLREVLCRSEVLGMRRAYFDAFPAAYCAAGTQPWEGIWSGHQPPELLPHGVPGHPAYDFVRSTTFAALAASPALLRIARQLLGNDDVVTLPRQIVRHYHWGPAASRAHTDFDYLDPGSHQLITMWIPLGDSPLQCGGLAYLEGSHRVPWAQLEKLRRQHTDRPHDPRPLSHDLSWISRQLGGRWLYSDYRAGDIVIHCPYLVHATFDNTCDVMRLSADIRFTPAAATPDPRWLRPWSGDDGN